MVDVGNGFITSCSLSNPSRVTVGSIQPKPSSGVGCPILTDEAHSKPFRLMLDKYL